MRKASSATTTSQLSEAIRRSTHWHSQQIGGHITAAERPLDSGNGLELDKIFGPSEGGEPDWRTRMHSGCLQASGSLRVKQSLDECRVADDLAHALSHDLGESELSV